MLSTRNIGSTLAALVAAAGLATAVAPAVSQAEPVEGEGAPVSCSYNGDSYGVGERISVISGAHYDNYYCGSDGQWHLVEHSTIVKSVTLKKLGGPIASAPLRARARR